MPIYPRPAWALCALLVGCTLGSDRPPGSTVPLPVSHLDARAEQGWQLYRDPDLNVAVQEALSQNRDLRMAAANLLQARALLRETDTLRQPATQVTAWATQERLLELVRLLAQAPVESARALHSAALAPLRQQALGLMDKVLHRDALLLAYSDAFLLARLAMLLCVVAGLLLRRA